MVAVRIRGLMPRSTTDYPTWGAHPFGRLRKTR
jgi:hypothetical protein